MNGPDRTAERAAGLLAATTLAVLESLRVIFPTSYGVADAAGNGAAALAVLVVFVVPVLAALVGQLFGSRRPVVVLAAAWAVWRLAIEVPDTVPFWMAAIGAVLALSWFSLTLSTVPARGHGGRAVGIVGGFALDALLMATFVTWDPAWQRTAGPWIAAALIASGALGTALWYRPTLPGEGSDAPGPGFGASAGLAFGAVLALETLFLLNPAAVAAASGLSLAWAALFVAAAAMLAIVAPMVPRQPSPAVPVSAAVVLCGVGFALPQVGGAGILALVVIGQLAVGIVVASALQQRTPDPGPTRAGLGISLGWLVLMLTTLLYQLHFDAPLPFDNSFVVAAAGALTGLAAVGAATSSTASTPPRRLMIWLGVPLLLVAIVSGALSLTAPKAGDPGADQLRVVQWNVRQAVDDQGQLDPAAVARAIAEQGPVDVVVLSEVARGWPLSGDLDLATWLSRELGLPFVWGPASGEQFGNTVLTRLPVESSEVVELPSAGRSQGRSATRLELSLADGRTLQLIGTHLQNKNDSESKRVRMIEVDRVIALWADRPLTIVAGDLNPEQGDPPEYPKRVPERFDEIQPLLGAGLVPTTDLSGCPRPTSNDNCSDYVFVTADLDPIGYRLVDVPGFDHRMLVADLAVTPAS